jgi:hypothetical protein
MDSRSFNIETLKKFPGGDDLLKRLEECAETSGLKPTAVSIRVDVDAPCGAKLKRVWDGMRRGEVVAATPAAVVMESSITRPPAFQPVPREKWPAWAKAVAVFQAEAEVGVGDTFKRLAAGIGGELYIAAWKVTGLPCNCAERRGEWNVKYSYSPPEETAAPAGPPTASLAPDTGRSRK